MQSFKEFIFKWNEELCIQTFVTNGQVNGLTDRQDGNNNGES